MSLSLIVLQVIGSTQNMARSSLVYMGELVYARLKTVLVCQLCFGFIVLQDDGGRSALDHGQLGGEPRSADLLEAVAGHSQSRRI